MTRITLILTAVLSLAFTPVAAQDFTVAQLKPLAEDGNELAQFELGHMYENGRGVTQDYAEAMKWYRLAADQGYAAAQNNLGVMYKNGLGVLQDNVMAHMWYNIASANGHDKAGEWRDERAGQMTTEDISKAQAMARECMSSGYKNCGY